MVSEARHPRRDRPGSRRRAPGRRSRPSRTCVPPWPRSRTRSCRSCRSSTSASSTASRSMPRASGSPSSRRSSAARPSTSSVARSRTASAPSACPSRVDTTFEVPWTSERISPAGRRALAAAGIAPPSEPARRALPVLRLRTGSSWTARSGRPSAAPCSTAARAASRSRRSSRSRARTDPVTRSPRTPSSVRDRLADSPAERTPAAHRSASSAPGRWVPASRRSRSRPAPRSSSTTSTPPPSSARETASSAASSAARRSLDLDADTIDAWTAGRLERLREARTLDARRRRGRADRRGGPRGSRPEARDLPRPRCRCRADDTILATNTSALSIEAIAVRRPDSPSRVLGLHFFNPVPRMALVEVVPGRAHRRGGRRPVPRTSSGPGARRRSAARTRRASSSTASTVRSRSRRCACSRPRAASVEAHRRGDARRRLPAGPVRAHGPHRSRRDARGRARACGRAWAARSVCGPRRSRSDLVAEGRLGRKTGSGFYEYTDGRRGSVAAEFRVSERPANRAAPAEIDVAILEAIDARGAASPRRRRRDRVRHRPGAPPRCRPPDGPVRANGRARLTITYDRRQSVAYRWRP